MNRQKINTYNFITRRHFISYIVLIGCLLAGAFVAQFVSLLVAGFFNNFNFTEALYVLSPPFEDDSIRNTILTVQGVNHFVLFTISSLFYLHFYEGINTRFFFNNYKLPPYSILIITVILVIVYMPISAFTAHYNEMIQFPSFFEGFARSWEDKIKSMTLFMIDFDSNAQFFLGLLVAAVIPGVGEELLFRGIVQNKFERTFGNVHIAIWLTAFIFSAIHIQFYGFLPRMLLGALFGYLYVWSGSLLVPMLAHFVNNGFTLLMMYLYNSGASDLNIDSPDSYNLTATLFSIIFVSGLIWYFRKIKFSQSS